MLALSLSAQPEGCSARLGLLLVMLSLIVWPTSSVSVSLLHGGSILFVINKTLRGEIVWHYVNIQTSSKVHWPLLTFIDNSCQSQLLSL